MEAQMRPEHEAYWLKTIEKRKNILEDRRFGGLYGPNLEMISFPRCEYWTRKLTNKVETHKVQLELVSYVYSYRLSSDLASKCSHAP